LGRELAMSNRVYIDRPLLTRRDEKTFHKLDDYLPVLEGYDPKALDAASLRQLVEAYLAKAAGLENPEPQEEAAKVAAPEAASTQIEPPATGRRRLPAEPESEPVTARSYLEKALAAGQVAFVDAQSKATGDDELLKLARIIAPVARDQLTRSDVAFQIWEGASRRVRNPEAKAECFVEAADIAINDLLKAAAMKPVLEAAARSMVDASDGRQAARLAGIWGDFHAATGDGPAARDAYRKAEQVTAHHGKYTERTAWRGAHSRSVEAFLRDGEYHRAVDQLRKWQTEFPTERIDGYLTLMYARYWAELEKWPQAIAQAEQLQAVNPDSPYVDQALLLAARCEMKRQRPDRAVATLRSLLTEHPGSPLVPEVKKMLATLDAGDAATNP
ncbi:MAG: tetratricopeptide repeat protein, partial [Patescibacteria group bacterium]|nr:tetratricopeptide repeat protein [Patescibacteria group bacterium]